MQLVATKFQLNSPISWGVSFGLYCIIYYREHGELKNIYIGLGLDTIFILLSVVSLS